MSLRCLILEAFPITLLTPISWLYSENFMFKYTVYSNFYLFVQLEVPKELISSSQLEDLRSERRPSFVPLGSETNVQKVHDKETGITQCRLSNGIPVNYKVYHMIHSAEQEEITMLFSLTRVADPCCCNYFKLLFFFFFVNGRGIFSFYSC